MRLTKPTPWDFALIHPAQHLHSILQWKYAPSRAIRRVRWWQPDSREGPREKQASNVASLSTELRVLQACNFAGAKRYTALILSYTPLEMDMDPQNHWVGFRKNGHFHSGCSFSVSDSSCNAAEHVIRPGELFEAGPSQTMPGRRTTSNDQIKVYAKKDP